MPNNINKENLGPAEQIINALLTYSDHLYHGRPGVVFKDTSAIGLRWEPVTTKVENDVTNVYKLTKVGKKINRALLGTLDKDGKSVKSAGRTIAEFRQSGIYPEVAAWMYQNIANIYSLDNEFVAKWASYAYKQEHRDLKVVLAAFMLVQNRHGEPVRDGGKVIFHDEDYRDIGEAMMLLYDKNNKNDLNPKMLLRIGEVLHLPEIAKINHKLGFGRSARKPFYGRWTKTVDKWLRYREQNPQLLDGLIKAGFRKTVLDLSRRIGYKPDSEVFFEKLRWKQVQCADGRRSLAIGKEVAAAETWTTLSEHEICEKITQEKVNFKKIVSLVPPTIGMTRAIMAASIEAGCLSNKDLIIATPTIEELGLLKVASIKERWRAAIKTAEDQRAANIASRVRNQETKAALVEASDNATKKAVEEVTKGIRIYFMVDISGSMQGAIEQAKEYIAKLLQSLPKDKVHVCVFNTSGKELLIPHQSTAGVNQAFRGIAAGGGTDYGSGVLALRRHQPQADEDSLFIFVGDEGAQTFKKAVEQSGLNPVAFGLVRVVSERWGVGSCVVDTAAMLGIPCFTIDNNTFADAYAIPRTIRALIAATPVGKVNTRQAVQRVTLVDEILQTKLLEKPVWAS